MNSARLSVGSIGLLLGIVTCGGSTSGGRAGAGGLSTPPSGDLSSDAGAGVASTASAHLPLIPVADVDLPGNAVRFDYQDIDAARGHLIIAHMNDAAVDVVDLKDGSIAKRLTGIPTARGVVVGDDRIFVTSSPNQLVIIDAVGLTEIGRVLTGSAPDGVGWDGIHKIVGVSDQGDGAVSLISNAGSGARVAVPLGNETGNVVFDAARGTFWVTVVSQSEPQNQLIAIDPVASKATTRIALPGCNGAHGLRLHPNGQSALVACEGNDKLARVDLGGANAIVIADTGPGPDVLSIDPGLGWLYVAAESGDLTVFDLARPGLSQIDKEHVGGHAHSVAVDPATHRVYFPLLAGPKGTPALRIMQPATST